MNTPQTLTQRALDAHQQRAESIDAQNRATRDAAIEEAQNLTVGYTKRVFDVQIDPNEIGVYLTGQNGGSRTDFEVEGLHFCCEIRREPGPKQVLKLYVVLGPARHPVSGLADLGKFLSEAACYDAQAAHPTTAPETTSGA